MDISRPLFYGSLILLTLVSTVIIWGHVIGLALFLEHAGIEALPLVLIAEAGFSFLWITSMERLQRYLSAAVLAALIAAAGILMLLLAAELIYLGWALAGYSLYFLVRRYISDLLLYYVWQYIASYYDIGVRYLLPQLAYMSRIGSALGGFIFALAAPLLDTSSVVTVWIGGLAVTLLAIGIFADEMQGLPRLHTRHSEEFTLSLHLNLMNLARSFWRSRLMVFISISMMSMVFLATLILFRSAGIFLATFPGEAALLRWLAVLYGLGGLMIVPLQYRLLPTVLQRSSVTALAVIFPVVLGVMLTGVYALPLLAIAALSELTRYIFQYGLFEPVQQRIRNTLPTVLHFWEHTLSSGIFAPLGRLSAGILLLLYVDGRLSTAIIIFIGGLVMLLFGYVQYHAGQRHLITLRQSLAVGQYGFLKPSIQDPLSTNRDIVENLLARLHRMSPDDRDLLLIVHALAESGSEEGFQAIIAIWHQTPPTMQAALLIQIVEGWSRHQHEAEIRRLVNEAMQSNDPELRRAALQVMITYRSLLDAYQVAQYLIDPEPTISTLAAQNLLQHPSPKLARAAEAQLNWLSRSSRASTRALAVNALVTGGVNRFGERIIPLEIDRFQLDSSVRVRKAIVPVLEPEELIISVQDVSPAIRQIAIERLGHFRRSTRLITIALDANRLQIVEQRQMIAMHQRWHLLTALANLNLREGRGRALEELTFGLQQLDTLSRMRTILREMKYPSMSAIAAQLNSDRLQLQRGLLNYLGALFGVAQVRTATRAIQTHPDSEEGQRAMVILRELTSATIARQIIDLLIYSLADDRLLTGDNPLHIHHAPDVVDVLLDQDDEWRPILTLYALSALPTGVFNALTDSEKVHQILEDSRASSIDAIREATRLIRRALREEFVQYRDDSLLSRAISKDHGEEGHMLSTVERMLFLRNVSFFENLRLDQLRTLARICIEQAFNADEYILHKGEAGDSLFIVVEGRVQIIDPAYPMNNGIIKEMTAGDVLGEISLFDSGLRSADAVALTDCLLLVVHRDALDEALGDDPGIALDMLRVMADKLRSNNKAFVSISQRLQLDDVREHLND